METQIKKVDKNNISDYIKVFQEAGDLIKSGELVAFPTETVYGLGADALNPLASKKIYSAKGRPSDNPLIVHISDKNDLDTIAYKDSEKVDKIIEAFWPGPLTIILNKKELVPMETTGGLSTVAIRMPSNIVARKLIEFSGGFIAAPSANTSGRPSPTLAKFVFEDMEGKIPLIIDGGSCEIGLESTILDLTTEVPSVLRPGGITREQIEEVIGKVSLDLPKSENEDFHPKAPGMKYKHYAPKAELYIIDGEDKKVLDYMLKSLDKGEKVGKKIGIITTIENKDYLKSGVVKIVGTKEDESLVAASLFRVLREFDDEGVDFILSPSFANVGIGVAIMNRLKKAAGNKIIQV
ncbi:MAG: threonylcarbamoyl-AMP synthase [Lachnospiraceae bacterium]|nr:threonylcarbamoyl-AMP synthase [Lachnospiraceae bacterium]